MELQTIGSCNKMRFGGLLLAFLAILGLASAKKAKAVKVRTPFEKLRN